MHNSFIFFARFAVVLAVALFCKPLAAQMAANADSTVVVGKISIFGNEKTKEYIILREVAFRPGDTLTLERLEMLRTKAMRQIFNLSLFISVDMEILKPDSLGRVNIDIHVKERWYLFIIPIIEIADRNFNQWWISDNRLSRLNYGVRITRFNLRGRNETMRVSLQGGFTRKFSVDYSFPYINKKLTIGSDLNFTYSDNREVWYATRKNKLQFYRDDNKVLYQRLKGSIGINYRKNIYTTHSAMAEYTNLWIADTVAKRELNPDYFLDGKTRQQAIYVNYRFIYDFRDFRQYALNGKYLGIEAGNYFFITPGLPIQNLYMSAAWYKKLAQRHYFNISGSFKLSSPSRQPYFFYKALGYDYYVRGFEYNVIDGQNFALGQFNYLVNILKQRQFHLNTTKLKKFRTIPLAVYAKAFYDAGYVHDKHPHPTNTYANSYLGGVGLGLDFITYYDRVLKVEYSFNNKGKSGLFLHFNVSF